MISLTTRPRGKVWAHTYNDVMEMVFSRLSHVHWQYISCLPGPSSLGDPFDVSEVDIQPPQRTGTGKLKRPAEPEGDRGNKPPAKKPKKAGMCHLFNTAPNGCPYGKECIFVHRCNNCGAVNEHHRLACPFPPRPPPRE